MVKRIKKKPPKPGKKYKVKKEKTYDHVPKAKPAKLEGVSKSLARVLNAEDTRKSFREQKQKNDKDNEKKSGSSKTAKEKDEKPTIKPGESLRDFNRRVEAYYASTIAATVRSSNKTGKKRDKILAQEAEEERERKKLEKQKKREKKLAEKDEQEESTPRSSKRKLEHSPEDNEGIESEGKQEQQQEQQEQKQKQTELDREFATAIPRSINDVAQEPPTFSKLPRKARKLEHTITDPSKPANKGKIPLSLSQQEALRKERERAIQRYREIKNDKLQALANKTT